MGNQQSDQLQLPGGVGPAGSVMTVEDVVALRGALPSSDFSNLTGDERAKLTEALRAMYRVTDQVQSDFIINFTVVTEKFRMVEDHFKEVNKAQMELCLAFLQIPIAVFGFSEVGKQAVASAAKAPDLSSVLDEVYNKSPQTIGDILTSKGVDFGKNAKACWSLSQIAFGKVPQPKESFLQTIKVVLACLRDTLANPPEDSLPLLKPLADLDWDLSMEHGLRKEMEERFKAMLVGYCFYQSGLRFAGTGGPDRPLGCDKIKYVVLCSGENSSFRPWVSIPGMMYVEVGRTLGEALREEIRNAVRTQPMCFVAAISKRDKWMTQKWMIRWPEADNIPVPCDGRLSGSSGIIWEKHIVPFERKKPAIR